MGRKLWIFAYLYGYHLCIFLNAKMEHTCYEINQNNPSDSTADLQKLTKGIVCMLLVKVVCSRGLSDLSAIEILSAPRNTIIIFIINCKLIYYRCCIHL